MQELSREQKTKIIESLPEDLRGILESENTGIFILSLSEQYSLYEEKLNLLSKIIGNVVLGLIPLTSLAQELNTQITPDTQIALRLAQDLNVELFFPVVESLKQAPAIANAVLTGQSMPAVRPVPTPAPAPTLPTQKVGTPTPDVTSRGVGAVIPVTPRPISPPPAPITPPAAKIPGVDQYREPAEVISGPLKPKIGPEPMSAPMPIVPPVVTLRPLETMVPQKPVAPTPIPTPPAPRPVATMPAPMPAPQPIITEGGIPPQAVVKVPLPTPAPQPAPIKIPVAPAPATPRPLTFTRPVMPSTPVPAPVAPPVQFPIPKPDTYRELVEIAPLPVPPQLPTEEIAHPAAGGPAKQFITSTAESIDLEEQASDIVDLRQDKGRF